MIKGIIGKKIGMTQNLRRGWRRNPGNCRFRAGPCWVTQIKTDESDGYTAIQLGSTRSELIRTTRICAPAKSERR
jgi:large subunit ribosomal protein L3